MTRARRPAAAALAPLVALAVWGAAAAAVAVGCSRTASDGEDGSAREEGSAAMDTARIGPRLQRVMRASQDSVVGVFVRTRDEVDAEGRAALEAAGLRIGTVAGSIVTGRITARDAGRLALVRFVVYIEVAERIPVPRPPADISRDTPGGA